MTKPRDRSGATETPAGGVRDGKNLARAKHVQPPGWLADRTASAEQSEGKLKKKTRPAGW